MVSLFNNQNPNTMAIIANNPTDIERRAIRDNLRNIARGLISPDSVDIILKYGGSVPDAISSGEISKLANTSVWYDVETRLKELDEEENSSPPLIKGKYMSGIDGRHTDAKHRWEPPLFETLLRMSLTDTEGLLIRLVFTMGLDEEAVDSLDVAEKNLSFARDKFIKWVKENKKPDEFTRVKEDFDFFYLLRNAFAHGLTQVARPGLQFRPNPQMRYLLEKFNVNCEKIPGMALTLSLEPNPAFFDTWRVVGRCSDYLKAVNKNPSTPSLVEVINQVEEIAVKHSLQPAH